MKGKHKDWNWDWQKFSGLRKMFCDLYFCCTDGSVHNRSSGYRHLFNKVSKSINSVPRHYNNSEKYLFTFIKNRLMFSVAMYWNWHFFSCTERGYFPIAATLASHLYPLPSCVSTGVFLVLVLGFVLLLVFFSGVVVGFVCWLVFHYTCNPAFQRPVVFLV